jgi:hypothetical protein
MRKPKAYARIDVRDSTMLGLFGIDAHAADGLERAVWRDSSISIPR